VYGNTRQVAEAIARSLGDARVVEPGDVEPAGLPGLDLLIVGAPTQGGRPTPPVTALLRTIPSDALRNTPVCAFDTRIAVSEQGFPLRLLIGLIGYAAPRIAGALRARGGRLVAPPEGFIVEGKEGPLRAGELERAAAWARTLAPTGRSIRPTPD
jgi:flavodoxin